MGQRYFPGNAHVPVNGHAAERADHSGELLPHLILLHEIQIQSLKSQICSLTFVLLIISLQNTQEKFGSTPEDCDQKEMYKLLVRAVTDVLKDNNASHHNLWLLVGGCDVTVFPPCSDPTSLKPTSWSCVSSDSVTSPCRSWNSSSVGSAASLSWAWWRSSKSQLRYSTR